MRSIILLSIFVLSSAGCAGIGRSKRIRQYQWHMDWCRRKKGFSEAECRKHIGCAPDMSDQECGGKLLRELDEMLR